MHDAILAGQKSHFAARQAVRAVKFSRDVILSTLLPRLSLKLVPK